MLLEGIWKSRGYGWILKVDSTSYALFDYTPGACIEFERGSIGEFAEGFDLLVRDNENHLGLCVRNDITQYDFDRISAMPDNTMLMGAPRISNPRENLDFFWYSDLHF